MKLAITSALLDRRMGLLEDTFVKRRNAQTGMVPPADLIGPVERA